MPIVYLLLTDVNISDVNIAQNREQTGLHDDTLPFRTFYEMSKSPWQALPRVVDQRVDGADERILIIIDIVLVGLTSARCRCRMNLAHAHHTDVLIECKIGHIPLVIEPVIANDAYGTGMLLYV